jgi:hypothetical protein
MPNWWPRLGPCLVAAAVLFMCAPDCFSACCYFSAKDKDIQQPGQLVFLTWDPAKKQETFTVQPKFEGNAVDFGMVIPTPNQPKLNEMPRDFFKALAIYTIMQYREYPRSELLPLVNGFGAFGGIGGIAGFPGGFGGVYGIGGAFGGMPAMPKPPAVKVVETGVVGSLDYKILEAKRADDLFKWLKDNKYHYAGDEATLNFYVQKKWYFTVMKIDTMQMKKAKDGTYIGEVTPTRFQFSTDKPVYPLKITQISVKEQTEALFYIQAPTKMDLAGDFTYQHTWVQMLQAAQGCTPGGIPGGGEAWLKTINAQLPAWKKKAEQLEFQFAFGQRPVPNSKGRTPTTMEWAKRLTAFDIAVLQGKAPYREIYPDVDGGFTKADILDKKRGAAVAKVIQMRLDQLMKLRPNGFLAREAPADEIRQLQILIGHLQGGTFITKFRKIFARDEMNDDLELIAAKLGDTADTTQYEERLPSSPP